jgi:phage baseplate assembly protein W
MNSKENTNIGTCVNNLVNTFKGEVPYMRQLGIDKSIIDKPYDDAEVELAESVDDVIVNYEPRAELDDIDFNVTNKDGNFEFEVNINEMEV